VAKKRANGEGTLRKRTDGRWEARYTDPREIDPKKRMKVICKKTQKEVVEALKAALAEISENKSLLSNENPSVSEWLYSWMNEYRIGDLRDSTFESYFINIDKHISPIIGDVKIKELTGLHIQNMYNVLQKKKEQGGHELSASTIIKVRNIVSGALQQAVINRLIRENPMTGTKPPKVDDPDIRILTKEEQKQFVSVLPFFNTGNMFAVALATGMRIGELCALDISDINRKEKYININKTASRHKDKYTGDVSLKTGLPKTKYSIRKIPLLPSVEVMLDRQAELVEKLKSRATDKGNWNDNTLVFPTDEGNIHDKSGMRSSMKRILSRAGLPHMTIHALRHTYATTALNSGVAAQNVAKLLGHKDGATTLKFYAHYINTEATTQLKSLEQQNISHLGITSDELQKIMFGTAEALEKTNLSERIDTVINNAKNFPPKKSIDMVLSVCNDVLCEPLDKLSANEKEILLGTLAQYTYMKRQQEKQERPPKKNTRER